MGRLRPRAGLLAGVALSIPGLAAANEPASETPADTELDAELLEFLGTVDELGAEWTEYLTQTDIEGVVEAKRSSSAKDETDD
jgi:hypothetical protein